MSMNWNPLILDDFAGVNYSGDFTKLKANQSPQMYNYIPRKTNNKRSLRKREGCFRDHSIEAGPSCNGLTRYYDGSSFYIIGKFGNKIYSINPTDNHEVLMTGLEPSAEIFFENWLGGFYFVAGNKLYRGEPEISEVTLSDENGNVLTGEKPTGTIVIQHLQRLWWFGGHSTPFFSETDFPDRYATRDNPAYLRCSVSLDNEDGTNVVAGLSYNGKLIFWKHQKMFFVLGDDALDNLEVVRFAPVGAYSQNGVCYCGDGFVRWYGPDGIYQYSDVTGLVRISDAVIEELKEIDTRLRAKVCAGWHDGLFLLFYPIGAEYNNRGLAYDPTKGEWYPIRGWNVAKLCKFEDGSLHAGWSNEGWIKKLFIGTNDDGEEIETYWQSVNFISEVERCIDKMRFGIANVESEVYVSWHSDTATGTNGTLYKRAMPPLGDRLADKDDLSGGGFILADAGNLAENASLLVDEEQIERQTSEFAPRLRPGQRFRELYFTIREKSMEPHQINYLIAWTQPTRRL